MTRFLKRFGLPLAAAWLLTAPAAAQQIHLFRGGGGFLGVEIRNVDEHDVAEKSLDKLSGVVVESVMPESAAAEAGLLEGDVILEYAGVSVLGSRQFRRLISETPPGREVDLVVSREGRRQTLTARIGERDPAGSFGPVPLPRHDFDFDWEGFDRFRIEPFGEGQRIVVTTSRHRLGITAVPITEQLAGFLQVPKSEGLLVTEVEEGSPAAEAGLQAGDVITAVNGSEVATPHRLSRRLEKGEDNELEAYRRGERMTFTVKPEERRSRSGRRL